MNPFIGMSPRELEIFSRFLAKVNPPPILHRYRRASEWTIKELSVPEVHIAGVEDMNDPFEYRAPMVIDVKKMRKARYSFARDNLGLGDETATMEALIIDESAVELLRQKIEQLRGASGLVCCSSNPRSNRMWAYYGDAHKGICIGYSTQYPPFCLAREITYADPKEPINLLDTLARDPSLLSDQLSCRKGAEWDFEQEFRVPVGPFPNDHTRLLPVSPEAIVEIRLGARICPDFKEQIVSLGRGLPHKPRIIQMDCDHKTFRLTESIL